MRFRIAGETPDLTAKVTNVWRQLYGVMSSAPISDINVLKSRLAKLAALRLPLYPSIKRVPPDRIAACRSAAYAPCPIGLTAIIRSQLVLDLDPPTKYPEEHIDSGTLNSSFGRQPVAIRIKAICAAGRLDSAMRWISAGVNGFLVDSCCAVVLTFWA